MSKEKKKLTQEEAEEKLKSLNKKLNKKINDFANAISDEVNSIKEILPEQANLEQLARSEIGENLDFLFIYDFAKETRIEELVKETGKTVETVTKEYQDEIKVYCGLFIYNVVKELKKEEYNGVSFSQLVCEGAEADGYAQIKIHPGSKLEKLVKTAREAAEEAEKTEKAEEYLQVIPKKLKNFEIGVDKLNNTFFSSIAPPPKEAIDGQQSFTMLDFGKNKEIPLYYNYFYDLEVFEKYKLKKGMSDFDFFVMSAVDNLKMAGNDYTTVNQIALEVCGKANPGQRMRKNIVDSLTKLLATTIVINDKAVKEAYGKGDTYKEIISPLLPIQIGLEKTKSRGVIVEDSIKINGEAPLMIIARETNQRTLLPKEIFINDITKTKRYFSVLHIVLRYVVRYKNPTTQTTNKILYETFHEEMGDKDRRQEEASKAVLYEILEHLKKIGFITSYEEETTKSTGKIGVKFTAEKTKKMIK